MKLLLALSLLLTATANCVDAHADLDDSIECIHNETGIYKKIYINSDEIQITGSQLLLKRASHSLPIYSLHSDARGLYLRSPVVDSYWQCIGCQKWWPDTYSTCKNVKCSLYNL